MTTSVERFDHAVLAWLDGRATPWLDRRALEATALGDGYIVTVLVVVAASLLWLLRERMYAACVTAAAAGAAIMTPLLKNTFDRPRPEVLDSRVLLVETSWAYPSGHALLASATLFTLAYVIHRLAGRRAVTVAAVVLASLLVLLTGWSRLHLGVHYPSDVLAGTVIGLGWALLCARTADQLRARAERRSGHDLIEQEG